jgi:hypothetical protein
VALTRRYALSGMSAHYRRQSVPHIHAVSPSTRAAGDPRLHHEPRRRSPRRQTVTEFVTNAALSATVIRALVSAGTDQPRPVAGLPATQVSSAQGP